MRVLAGLCCTHYGYAADRFRDALSAGGAGTVEIIDPNTRMNDILFPPGRRHAAGQVACTVEVVSRAVISPEETISIGGLGVSQAAYPFFYVPIGVSADHALAVSLLMQLTQLLASLPGGLFWLRTRRATRASGPSVSGI